MDNSNAIQRLEELRGIIEQSKTEKANLDGQLKATLDSMEKEFGVSTVEDAEALLEEMRAKATRLTDRIQKGVAELEEKYEW